MINSDTSTAPIQHPWILSESDNKKVLIKNLEKIIHKASFIPEDNEENWKALLPYFSEDFLEELKQTLIRENLRKLSKKHTSQN